MFGAFFCRPDHDRKDRNKLKIRKLALIDSKGSRRHEPPLCGGYCLFYNDGNRLPVTGDGMHTAKVRLSLNLQRFIRHQPQRDDPLKPWKYRLQKRPKKRTSYNDEEQAMDGEDNWVPNTPEWQKFAAREHLEPYLELIADQTHAELSRACRVTEKLNKVDEEDWYSVGVEREDHYRLSMVETFWEFPSETPVQDVWAIGAKLMHLTKADASVEAHEIETKEAGRKANAPCFSIPLAEGVRLKLYAKTNKRIRFEIVQKELGDERKELLKEAEIQAQEGRRPWSEIAPLLKALRVRAAKHMNTVMEHLRADQTPPVKAKSVVQLLAEVAIVASGMISKDSRLARLQTLLSWLCCQRGYRGSIDKGPYASALKALEKRGIIKFYPSSGFYALCDAYKEAANALVSATGEPLLNIFGADGEAYKWPKDSKMPIRLRE